VTENFSFVKCRYNHPTVLISYRILTVPHILVRSLTLPTAHTHTLSVALHITKHASSFLPTPTTTHTHSFSSFPPPQHPHNAPFVSHILIILPQHTQHTQTLTFSSNGPESIARGKDGMTRGISFQGEGEESPQVRG
jgi:hypothetical protein